jgi:hypothetical protein
MRHNEQWEAQTYFQQLVLNRNAYFFGRNSIFGRITEKLLLLFLNKIGQRMNLSAGAAYLGHQ